MGTLNQLRRNNKASSLQGRPEKLRGENPAKRRIIDPVFGRQSSSERLGLASKSKEIVEMNNQAILFYENGEFQTASNLFLKAAAMRDKALHDETSNNALQPTTSIEIMEDRTARVDKASYIYQRMDFSEGMNVYNEAQPIKFDDHPVAVEAALLFNAGQSRRKLEDCKGASTYYQRALNVLLHGKKLPSSIGAVTAVSTTVHRVIIPCLHNLGQLAYRRGKLREAISFYELALSHCRSLNGANDFSVGITLNCLGVLYYHLSSEESDRAASYFHDALRIMESKLGADSALVATTLNNLGRVMVQQDDFDAALVHYEKALKIRRQVLGIDDIDYAATAFNAGQSLHQIGQYDRAIELYREFLRVARLKFSKEHRDIAVVLSGIAQIHQERKEYDQALKLYEESLRVGRAALGNYHSEVAMLLNRIGNFYFEREDFDGALKAYKEGLRIERKVLDKMHPNIVVTLSNIGEIYRQKGNYNLAIRQYTQAMDLQKTLHGESSAEVASTLNIIGLIYDQRGDTARALQALQSALVMRRTVLGDDHLDVSATLTYLGTILYRISRTSTAMEVFSESLRIRNEKLGHNHRDVSFTLYNVGLCHQLQGNYKEAVSCFRETLRVEKLVLGDDHKDVSLTLNKLGEAYKADGDPDAALESFEAALEIERKFDDDEDFATTARTLNEIGNIYLAKGNAVDEMMKAFADSARMFRRAGLSIFSVNVSPALKLYAAGFDSAAAAA